uniref:AlNc14C99G5995 protein n=1 Tax=Albugo laibachii Nc14 TaxID=890382 RepID=F0WHD2_9STRA|nr:AlNc14C99G5995 [Albugo laibachii Nc14]|eukprot:CCA20650.1 AlNc14C99G5995 [Albugo laibachii Nc14]
MVAVWSHRTRERNIFDSKGNHTSEKYYASFIPLSFFGNRVIALVAFLFFPEGSS